MKGETRAVTQTSTKATAAAKDVDMVRYTSESLQISPNAARLAQMLPTRVLHILRKPYMISHCN